MIAANQPRRFINTQMFLRTALFGETLFDPQTLCHYPLVVSDLNLPLGHILHRLTVRSEKPGDDVIDEDTILVWKQTQRRIITGSDLLGRLLRKIVRPAPPLKY